MTPFLEREVTKVIERLEAVKAESLRSVNAGAALTATADVEPYNGCIQPYSYQEIAAMCFSGTKASTCF